jgi:drug/metabolite transporter (DMT)-like permease
VIVVSQLAGFCSVLVLVLASGEPMPAPHYLLIAAGGGLAGLVGLVGFYRALALGTMSIVAPISATGAAVPVLVGLATGEHPGAVRLGGIVAAVAGIVLVSRAGDDPDPAERDAPADAPAPTPKPAQVPALGLRLQVGLALGAALGFGTFFVAMDKAAAGGVLWSLLAARAADAPVLIAVALLVREQIGGSVRTLAPLVAVGVLDVLANGLYAWGTTLGLLSVVAVLGSLYPVTTVLLARAVLAERVRRVQEVGIATVLAGVALIAVG